jgi:hypothetical protein
MSPLDLESRLRSYAKTYEEDAQPPAGLHEQILSRTAEPARRRPNLVRELAFAAAFLLFIGLLAVGAAQLKNLATSGAGNHKTKPTPTVQPRVVPWINLRPTPRPETFFEPEAVTPAQAALTLKATVSGLQPVLVPSVLPANARALLTTPPGTYTVEYKNASSDFAIMVVSPTQVMPVAGSSVHFRNTSAEYGVIDRGHPEWGQFLLWTEPGESPADPVGVHYFLKAGGLSETAFWQMANSLGPIPASQIPACRTVDLQTVFEGGNGAGGHMLNVIAFSNRTSAACVLDGYPRLKLLTRSGTALPLVQTEGNFATNAAPTPVILGPHGPDISAGPTSQNGQASVIFEWSLCPEIASTVANISLTLPGNRGTTVVPVEPGTRAGSDTCFGASSHSLGVGPFQRVPTSDTSADATLEATIATPARAVRGKPLTYTVTLTNISGAPIVFTPCPAYTEILGQKAAVATYSLNCRAALPIPVGGTETFTMLLDLPANMVPGRQTLSWTLDWPFLVEGRTTVTVVG